jgi:hypothetical protein
MAVLFKCVFGLIRSPCTSVPARRCDGVSPASGRAPFGHSGGRLFKEAVRAKLKWLGKGFHGLASLSPRRVEPGSELLDECFRQQVKLDQIDISRINL